MNTVMQSEIIKGMWDQLRETAKDHGLCDVYRAPCAKCIETYRTLWFEMALVKGVNLDALDAG